MDDHDLYQQTLDQYNEPVYAKKYAVTIQNLLDETLFREFLPFLKKGARILDAGSGAGRDVGYLQSKGYKPTGIDYSRELTKIAKQKYPNLHFVIGDFTKLPFDNESFDGVWCYAALVHLPSQEFVQKTLAEFHRVLKKDGYLMIETKARFANEPESVTITDKLSSTKRYFRFYHQSELVDLCKAVGFKIVKNQLHEEHNPSRYSAVKDQKWLTIIAKKP